MTPKIWSKVPETIEVRSSFETKISAAIDIFIQVI